MSDVLRKFACRWLHVISDRRDAEIERLEEVLMRAEGSS